MILIPPSTTINGCIVPMPLHRSAPADQLAGRDSKIHEERRKKIHAARLKREHNLLREEIKLNKLEYKLTSKKVVLLPINEPLFFGIPIEPQHFPQVYYS